MTLLDLVIALLYITGVFFNLSAVVGILRLPDLYCRLHSSSKNTTLGSMLILVGLALRELQFGEVPAALKLVAIAILILIVNPIGSHALARASYKYGVPLWHGSVVDQTPGA
jgi:multicomponent Na+:H+ antiporter subunit G